MMVQRITIKPQQRQGASLRLEKDQAHYLIRVLRLGEGDRFIAQDGLGRQWLVALTKIPSQAKIIEPIAVSATPHLPLRLIAALPKGNSFDQVVRQATELGVSHLYPVLSDRTLLKPSDKKLARWQRIAQEASEQSERVSVPHIVPPTAFQQCLQRLAVTSDSDDSAYADAAELRYLCAARENAPHLLTQLVAQSRAQTAEKSASENLPGVILAIGPEGGWTSAEITDAITYGYEIVSLGSVILRTVTASITALSLVTSAREALI